MFYTFVLKQCQSILIQLKPRENLKTSFYYKIQYQSMLIQCEPRESLNSEILHVLLNSYNFKLLTVNIAPPVGICFRSHACISASEGIMELTGKGATQG